MIQDANSVKSPRIVARLGSSTLIRGDMHHPLQATQWNNVHIATTPIQAGEPKSARYPKDGRSLACAFIR